MEIRKMGAKGKRIREWVIGSLAYCPGQTTCDLCRQLNVKADMSLDHGIYGGDPLPIEFCKWKSCYANARKRAKPHHVSKCTCKYSLQLLAYHLKKMIEKGLIEKVKELRTDSFQNRGYDLYSCYYPL